MSGSRRSREQILADLAAEKGRAKWLRGRGLRACKLAISRLEIELTSRSDGRQRHTGKTSPYLIDILYLEPNMTLSTLTIEEMHELERNSARTLGAAREAEDRADSALKDARKTREAAQGTYDIICAILGRAK